MDSISNQLQTKLNGFSSGKEPRVAHVFIHAARLSTPNVQFITYDKALTKAA